MKFYQFILTFFGTSMEIKDGLNRSILEVPSGSSTLVWQMLTGLCSSDPSLKTHFLALSQAFWSDSCSCATRSLEGVARHAA